mgnify:CR=1 FL=1
MSIIGKQALKEFNVDIKQKPKAISFALGPNKTFPYPRYMENWSRVSFVTECGKLQVIDISSNHVVHEYLQDENFELLYDENGEVLEGKCKSYDYGSCIEFLTCENGKLNKNESPEKYWVKENPSGKYFEFSDDLVEKEIVVRLLDSPHGMHLRHMAALGSPNGNVLKAVTWLKQNFSQAIGMNELAEQAHMSASTFRQHFKALTGTSPLQYLKTLRLQEARDQMLVNGVDATLASNLVGYESSSQFSREYSRLFGLPPQKDIQRLREVHQIQ